MSQPDASLMVRSLLERATADLLRSDPFGTLAACEILTLHETKRLQFPRIVVEAIRCSPDENVNDLYNILLGVYVGTRIDEADSGERHRARVGRIEELLWSGEGAALKALVATSPDLIVHAVYADDSAGEPTAQHWTDTITAIVACQLKGA